MHITIKYFGQLVDVTGKDEELIEVNGTRISDIMEVINKKYNKLKHKDFQIAQNQELVSNSEKLTGAEIALLPPFSGG